MRFFHLLLLAPSLLPAEEIIGRAFITSLDFQQKPLHGAEITLHDGGSTKHKQITPEDGSFHFQDLKPGVYRLEASSAGTSTVHMFPLILPATTGPLLHVTIVAPLSGAVTGIRGFSTRSTILGLVMIDNEPAIGAEVCFFNSVGANCTRATTFGLYSISLAMGGPYIVKITSQDGAKYEKSVQIPGSIDHILNLVNIPMSQGRSVAASSRIHRVIRRVTESPAREQNRWIRKRRDAGRHEY